MEFPEVISPAELAKRLGWSERRIRTLARELGACRILGNRMALTKEDVDVILEATRPAPLRPLIPGTISSSSHNVSPDLLAWLVKPGSGYDELLRMRERDKRKKEAEKAKQPPRRRMRLPRFKPKD
jgi:hypothetical protein